MSKERPILFSSDMVRAILDGRKTQTRRIVKPQPGNVDGCYHRPDGLYIWTHLPVGIGCGVGLPFKCPYGQVGDRLYVRETFALSSRQECALPRTVVYKVDEGKLLFDVGGNWDIADYRIKWQSSRFMPKVLARIWLEITGIRVERVQEISEKEALKEGAHALVRKAGYMPSAKYGFEQLWDSLNAKRGYSWESNPFVWCISFKKIEK